MLHLDSHPSGRHYLQIPGPSPVPDRILRAISLPTIDHRGPEFGVLGLKARDIVGFTFLQLTVHLPTVLLMLWLLAGTLPFIPPVVPR